MQGGEPSEFFENVKQFASKADALREMLIMAGLRKAKLLISFHAANMPDIIQTITHEETADYIEEAQNLLSRLDRQLDHDAHSLQSLTRAAAAGHMLDHLTSLAANLMTISPPSEYIHIPYAVMTDDERKDALDDITLPLTRTFLKAALASPDMIVDNIDIKVEPAAEDEIKKARMLGGLAPGERKGLIVTATAMPGLAGLRVQ